MLLKNTPFTYAGHTVVLRELSALQRIDYLKYAAAHQVDEAQDDTLTYLAAVHRIDTQLNALLLAMSIIDEVDRENSTAVLALQTQLMASWPLTGLQAAGQAVMQLSDMLPADDQERGADIDADTGHGEVATPEKS